VSSSVRLVWSEWIPLREMGTFPAKPGLYRVRRVGFDGVDYIGQTGTTLRIRLGMLRGVFADVMPYRDPHTAAPALWALRHSLGCDFEASTTVVEDSTPRRKGLEAAAIASYRQERSRSPTANFGRMPDGYRMSTHNNRRLVERGRRFRGGPSESMETSHAIGVAPVGALDGDELGPGWCGHAWTDWTPIDGALVPRGAEGLYRIRADSLLYIGEGRILPRLRAHLAKTRKPGRQGEIFGDPSRLLCSYVVGDWLSHQREELETDLIGAYVLSTGSPPGAQYFG